MKSLFAIPLLALALMSFQANALCLYITDSFTGIVPGDSEQTAHGPFTVTSSGGCSHANIETRISALGVGRAPELYIERLVSGSWKRETFGISNSASYNGPLGSYRVRVKNNEPLPKAYSGTARYGR